MRTGFFVCFEDVGVFTSDLQRWEYYAVSATVVFIFHFMLSVHTIRRRAEWYENDDENDKNPQYFPHGIDVFFSCTQLLSAHLFARAMFGLFFLGFDVGPEHRGLPIFLDLLTCVVSICSFRHLLYSDYYILELINNSPSLNEWKDMPRIDPEVDAMRLLSSLNVFVTDKPRMHGSDRPADEVGENVEMVALENVFATERPVY